MEKFFLFLIIFFTLYIAYAYILPSMIKTWGYSFIGLILTSFLLIVLLDVSTLKPRPSGATSGNGNLGLLVLVPLVPVLAAFLVVWGKSTYRGFAKKKSLFLNRWMVGSLIGLSIAIFLQIQFALHKLEQLEACRIIL